MNRKLYHPLWVHLPAILVLIGVIIAATLSAPLPKVAPLHFAPTGEVDRYGSPWEFLSGVIGLSILYIAISVLIDELWARQENHKTFNWMSLFDEVTVGLLGGMAFGYIQMLSIGGSSVPIRWQYMIPVAGIAVIGGIIVEMLRPFVPHEVQVATVDTAGLEREIAERRETGAPMVYLESQNPFYITVLVVLVTFTLLIRAVISWANAPFMSAIMLVPAIITLMIYGGLRVMVTPNRFLVSLGVLGLHLLDVQISDIVSATVINFSPLRDFGGYGIRIGRVMNGYFFQGNRGVLVTTRRGKKYLIGSDNPDRLAAVLRAVME